MRERDAELVDEEITADILIELDDLAFTFDVVPPSDEDILGEFRQGPTEKDDDDDDMEVML